MGMMVVCVPSGIARERRESTAATEPTKKPDDFGTAFDWSKTGQSMTRSNAGDVRTPRYQSPEVADGEFHRSSDMWSLGVVFLEMVTILRGKTLQQMDEFLAAPGRCHSSDPVGANKSDARSTPGPRDPRSNSTAQNPEK